MRTMICKYCGSKFEANNWHHLCCSLKCQRQWYKEHPKKYTFICKRCSKEYTTIHGNRNQYCSRDCAFADIGNWYKKSVKKKEKKIKPITIKVCVVCGSKITSRAQKYCSNNCSKNATLYHLRMRKHSYPEEKICCICKKTFKTNGYSKRYCSLACRLVLKKEMERDIKIRRRARKKRAYICNVSRREIFERDHWVCGICGHSVDPTLKAPHPGSPCLDHIHPLARGGSHEPDNVQLAHFMCNSIKRDRMGDTASKSLAP